MFKIGIIIYCIGALALIYICLGSILYNIPIKDYLNITMTIIVIGASILTLDMIYDIIFGD